MNIALVNICLRPYMDKAYFPIGLSYVATALARAGHPFDVIDTERYRYDDGEIERLLSGKKYDIVAFGTLVSGYRYAKKIAAIARRTNPDALIVAGNSVASSIADHILAHTEVDVAVKGEGENTILRLVDAVARGSSLGDVKGIIYGDSGQARDTGYDIPLDIREVGHPEWDLFDMEYYLGKAIQDVPVPYPIPREQIRAFVVNTARGCPYRCTFCYHVFQYTKYRCRPADSILAEIRALHDRYGVNYINFFDELTFHSKRQIGLFVDKLLASGIRVFWNADIRADLFTEDDRPLLEKVRDSGCISFGYSLESGSPEILRSMGKRLTVEQFKRQKRILDKVGIKTFTSVVIGYPQETLETLEETFSVCRDLNIYPSIGYLLPQPGTPMFDVAKAKGVVGDMESFLMRMGDRQDLRFNLTSLPDDVLTGAVIGHLQKISDKLGLGLEPGRLIKTYSFLTSGEC